MGQRNRALQLSLGLAAAWWLLAAAGALEQVERLTMQARYWLRPAPGFSAPVAIVAIDEAALARYGQMPWDRRRFAEILNRVHAAGAAVVGIDVAFNEPAAHDDALAEALGRVPTVLPTFLAYAGAGGDALRVVEPLPAFSKAAIALGSVQLSRRQQPQIWEMEPHQDLLDRRVPAFPVAVAKAYKADMGPDAWDLGPLWRSEPAYLDFRGPAHSAPSRSAVALLEGPPPTDLEGRIVLVGATASGLADTNFSVPDLRRGPMAGVEIFAHALDNLLAGGLLRRLSLPALAVLLAALAFFPGAQLLKAIASGRRRPLLWLGATAAWLALATGAFFRGVWIEAVPVVGFLFSCYFGGVLAERGFLLRSRNQLLERYASDMAAESQRQRARIEGELHDGVQQLLVAIGRDLRQVRKHLADPEKAEARAARASEMAEEAIAEIKRLRQDLLPPALRHEGLAGALGALAGEMTVRGGFEVRLAEEGWAPLPQEAEVELYWLVKEALNNAEKHAGARHVVIRLAREGGQAVVEVVDDGRGFTPPDLSVPPQGAEHSGLHRMWLRMRGRGGDLVIDRPAAGGSRLRFLMPHASQERNPS